MEVLTAIANEIELESPGVRVAIHHRIGTLVVGDQSGRHRRFRRHIARRRSRPCRSGIERLKQRAPIWKKEIGEERRRLGRHRGVS